AIGTAEIVHAANRGENLTTVFVNNAVYGMTRGQMAPTTMLGQKTTTTAAGRDPRQHGYPLRVCEMLAGLDGVVYLERLALSDPASVRRIKAAIRKGFECQLSGQGFSLIEVLSPCPVNWNLSPVDSLTYVREVMSPVFPPGVIKDRTCQKPAPGV
ncbi:MAG TPA: thiamine pyrophosphate-dependent enzyme, partial [bacterium]|nr:thiamine pyrophosphate-dependent enzyme [bacterium]